MNDKIKVRTTGVLLDDLDLFNKNTDLNNNPFIINVFNEVNKLEKSKDNIINNTFPEQRQDFYEQKRKIEVDKDRILHQRFEKNALKTFGKKASPLTDKEYEKWFKDHGYL